MSDERMPLPSLGDGTPDAALAAAIARWKDSVPPLDPAFERRVLAALAAEGQAVPHPLTPALSRREREEEQDSLSRLRERVGVRGPARLRSISALLAAGLVGLVAGGYLAARAGGWIREAPSASGATMLIAYDALGDVRAAEEQHRRALARLQEAAQPVLARAGDPGEPAREAALLIAYRDRLRFLDSTIAELVTRVEENPYNAKGRAVLLAAYREKSEILREVLALGDPSSSIGGA